MSFVELTNFEPVTFAELDEELQEQFILLTVNPQVGAIELVLGGIICPCTFPSFKVFFLKIFYDQEHGVGEGELGVCACVCVCVFLCSCVYVSLRLCVCVCLYVCILYVS